MHRVHEIFLIDEKQSDVISFKSNSSSHLAEIETNFSKTTLSSFRNQEEDDDLNNVSNQTETYVEFNDGLRLKIKNISEREQQNFSQNDELKSIVLVDTTKRNLNKIAMSIVTDSCIVVDGPSSSGKTTLIEYLANKSNNKLIKYQMDEYMDSKVNSILHQVIVLLCLD